MLMPLNEHNLKGRVEVLRAMTEAKGDALPK
jgi:hypothetical protein